MQILKQHKRLVLLVALLVTGLIISLFIVQRVSLPSSKPSPTPTPSMPLPTLTAMPSSTSPTSTSSSPSQPTPSQIQMPPPPMTPAPTLSGGLYPGEVTHYQNYSLTPVSAFEEDIAQHPDVAIMGTQYVNEATYHLEITGLVKTQMNYTYADVVNNFPLYQQVSTLLCVEGWSVTMLWQGASVTDLIQKAGVSPAATVAIFYGADGYTSALPLSYIAQNNIILAYKINNVTLPADTGFPLALVASNQYGYKWVKWVTEIEVSNDTGYLGYWESRGYPNNATVSSSDGSLSNPYTIAEIVGFSAVAIVVAVACYLILAKVRKKYSIREENEQISA